MEPHHLPTLEPDPSRKLNIRVGPCRSIRKQDGRKCKCEAGYRLMSPYEPFGPTLCDNGNCRHPLGMHDQVSAEDSSSMKP